jgi:enamine deaminase RidA (YjgF/YER057c/UK114 family)
MVSGASSTDKRRVAGTIDAGGVYCSRAAAGGGFVFFGGTALDGTGRLADHARPGPPYAHSAAAQVRIQTRYLFERFRDLLPLVGSSLHDVVAMEHYLQRKVHADGYFQVALGSGFLESDRPVGATAATGGQFPEDAVISVTGLAIVPDDTVGRVKGYPEEIAKNPLRLYPEMVTAGPYIATTYLASHPQRGLDPAVRAESWNWRGSEIRSEAEHCREVMKARLAAVGASLTDIVDYTMFLTELGDLHEVDLTWGRALGASRPTRTVIRAQGYQVPRREGAFGHSQGAPRLEIQFRCLRPSYGVEKVAVSGPGAGLGTQSAGIRVGPLLWISSQVADERCRSQGVTSEIDDVFGKLAVICGNGGTDLGSLLRVRALVTRTGDALAVYAALRKVIPSAPPVVTVLVLPAPLHVHGCSVALDAVAHVAPG